MRNDYVTQLMTGKINGKGEFVPFKTNPNASLNEIIRSSNKSAHDILVHEGLRQPLVSLDSSVNYKSKKEKDILKKIKSEHKKALLKAGFNSKKRLNLSNPTTLSA